MRVMKSLFAVALALCSLTTACNLEDTEPATKWPRSIAPRLSGSQWRPCTPKLPAGAVVEQADCGATTLQPVSCNDAILTVAKARQLLLTQPTCTGTATKALQQIALTHPEAKNDLAAAYYVRAQRDDRPVDLLSALDAVNDAPRSPESLFNRALIEEALGLRDDALAAWNAFLAVDHTQWAAEARAHRDALAQRLNGADQWARNKAAADRALRAGDMLTVERLIAPFPNSAIGWVEEDPDPELATAVSLVTKDEYAVKVAPSLRRSTGASQLLSRARAAVKSLETGTAASEYQRLIAMLDRLQSPLALTARLEYATTVLKSYKQQLQLLDPLEKEARARGYRHLAARILLARSNALLRQSRFDESIHESDEALTAYRQIGNDEGAAGTLIRRSGTYWAAGASPRAWRDEFEALRLASHLGTTKEQHNLLDSAASLALTLGHPQAALAYQNAAIRLFPTNNPEKGMVLRDRAAIDLAVGKNDLAVIDLKAAAAMAKPDDQKAQQILRARYEEINGRTLLKTNALGAAAAFGRAYNDASHEFHTYRAALLSERADAYSRAGRAGAAQHDLVDAAAEFEAEQDRVLKSRKRGLSEDLWSAYFSRFQSVYQALIRDYIQQHRIYAALQCAERARAREPLDLAQVPPKPFDLAELQQWLPPGTVAFEYAVLDDRTIVWIIRPNRLDAIALDVPRKTVEEWNAGVESGNSADFVNAIDAAYEGLIDKPLKALGGTPRRLAIIRDSSMEGLPFNALRDTKATPNVYLIERAPIEIAGSAQLYLLSLQGDAALRASTNRSILLVGNPTNDLPQSGVEVRKLMAIYGSSAKALLEGDATVPHFLAAVPGASVIHIASHSTFDTEAPFKSSIAFASSPLYAYELVTLFRPKETRLVILASCSSAAGGPVGPEGVAPLVRPLIAAGVPAVIGTSRPVSDATAERLLVSFHQRYRKGDDAAVALRNAQLEMLHKKDAAENAAEAWGAFEVIGHGSSPFAAAPQSKEKPP
jgi:CHAT domain-containing protein